MNRLLENVLEVIIRIYHLFEKLIDKEKLAQQSFKILNDF